MDGCISPFSNGTSHIALETLLETAHVTNRETTLTHTALQGAYEEANELATKYIASGQYPAKALMINPNILTYQVPGGMLSNLMSQLKDQGASDRYEEVLKEIPKVREDLGYPPLVTPLSQMVGTQAVLNVLTGTRYKMVPKEIKDYAMGLYGTFPGPVNEEIINLILKDEKRVEKQPVESMPSVYEASKIELESKLGREALEEEVLSYILFPQNAILEGEEPKVRPEFIEFKMFDGGACEMSPTFTFLDGLTVSLFSMLVVFVILLLLALVLQVFTAVLSKFDKPEAPTEQRIEDNDEEHRLVAKLVVSLFRLKKTSLKIFVLNQLRELSRREI
ncbi:OadG family protein [Erysipelothrix sp. Poltava]|nr:OadG family protein [Erysipelothrix sp. Poltava]